MENWQFWFMIGSGIYLLILGIVMIVKKDLSMNKAIDSEEGSIYEQGNWNL